MTVSLIELHEIIDRITNEPAKKRLETLGIEKTRFEWLLIARSRKNSGLTNREIQELRQINDEIDQIVKTHAKQPNPK